jgi:hypothetical protein
MDMSTEKESETFFAVAESRQAETSLLVLVRMQGQVSASQKREFSVLKI